MWTYVAAASLALVCAGTPRGGAPETWETPWDGASFRSYRDEPSGVVFPLPFSGFRFEARHLPAAREAGPGVARHNWILSGPWGAEVTVDAWENTGGVLLQPWIERHLSFLYLGEPSLFSGPASARALPSLGFHHVRTGQSFARRTVVFAAGRRVFRITCENADDPRQLRIFEEVLRGLEPGGAP